MSSLRIFLRPGEKVFVNGAVMRADRKVSLEVLNDVSFLLESHVLQADETTTPLRQLYFIIQSVLMNPATAPDAIALYSKTHAALMQTFSNPDVIKGLQNVADVMGEGRAFEALKIIRQLYPLEKEILEARGAAIDLDLEAV